MFLVLLGLCGASAQAQVPLGSWDVGAFYATDAVFPSSVKVVLPYKTCMLVSGTLPPGMTLALSGEYCQFSGTPTTIGSYSWYPQIADSGGNISNTTTLWTMTINPAMTITTTSLPSGLTNSNYTTSLVVTGGTPPYQWSASSGLPNGILLSSSGTLSGSATQSGVFTFTSVVTDAGGGSTFKQFQLQISGGTLSLSCSQSAGPTSVGVNYTDPCTVSGGVPPYTWSISAGSLPNGLNLNTINATQAAIEGTPSGSGPYSYTVNVADSAGANASRGFSGTLSACGISLSSSSVDFPSTATPTNQQFTVSAAGGCPWTASTSSPFLTITGSANGTGIGTVSYSVTSTSSSFRQGTINVTGTSGFTVNQVIPALAVSSAPPTGACNVPAEQKYFSPNATIYSWFGYAPGSPGNGSDVVTATVLNSAGVSAGVKATLQPGGGCFLFPISLSGLSSGSYTLSFSLNNVPAGNSALVIVPNQITLGTAGDLSSTLIPLPGLNQENLYATLPNVLPDASTVTFSTTFSPSGTVVNAAQNPGAYDCRFVQQSGANVTIPAAQTQSPSSTVSGGTVAGTCNFGVAGASVPTWSFQYSPSAIPVSLTNIANSNNSPYIAAVSQMSPAANSTLTVVVTGYSMTRDLSQITYAFNPASGTTLNSGTVVASVQTPAAAWYTSAGSAATGGQFQYTQSFNISPSPGTSADLSSVTVTVTLTTGTSPPVTISLN